jgi:predicted CXXCH cytochrome family protein
MYVWGVQCNDCHNVHSGKLVLPVEDNQLCLQCHKAEDYNTPVHHHHKGFGEQGDAVVSESGVKFEVGSGTQCYNCHMHGGYYMGVDYRRDHSFRIPRPDLSEKLGTPNACNQCHVDKSNKWSENYIYKWFGTSRHSQFGEAIFDAQKGIKGVDDRLISIITSSTDVFPTSKRATALSRLTFETDSSYKILYSALNDIDPQMRLIAVRTLQIQSQKDINRLLPMLSDEAKAVRMETANKLSFLTDEQVPSKYKKRFKEVLKEYEEVLIYSSDFPMGKFSLGNLDSSCVRNKSYPN